MAMFSKSSRHERLPLTAHCASTRASFARCACLLVAFGGLVVAASAQTDNWIGGTGNWSDPTQWSNGVPAPGENVVIGTATANSTDDIGLEIGTLTLSNPGDAITLPDASFLAVTGLTNEGTITLDGTNYYAHLLLQNSLTLTGNGVLILNPSAVYNSLNIISSSSANIFTNASTILGGGYIGEGDMGFVNAGVVHCTAYHGMLIYVGNNGFSNQGLLEATDGSILEITGPANSFLNYNSATGTLTGGSYIANDGFIWFIFSSSQFVTTLAASVTQENGGSFIGAFDELSTITSSGSFTTDVPFVQPGAFNMAGRLNILPHTSFSVGSLAQITGATLTGGNWILGSDLVITGTPPNIATNSASVTLTGGTFFNSADGTNALANLSTNKKALSLTNFTNFTSTASFVNSGVMNIAKGSTLTIGGSANRYIQNGGKMTLDGVLKGTAIINRGTLLGTGLITGNGSLASGVAATLNIGC